MNALCYKIVFSKRLGALVAVGEHTSGQGKATGTGVRTAVYPSSAVGATGGEFVGSLKAVFASVALTCFTATTIAAGPAANTLPTGYSVNSGHVAVSTSGADMTIKQSTDKASVNWQSFSIGSAASVNIQQNSASSVLLNRVVGNDPSQIFGKLTANGQVILINPNGIVFGKGGSVTASAFTASTFAMTEDDFNKGKRKFSRNGSTASVTVEEGASINTTTPGGYIALIASNVNNQGSISAKQGSVVLAAAETVTLPSALTENVGIPLSSKVRLELAPSTINASVENGGTITTEGGQVLMQAAAVADAVASITHTGSIDTTGEQGGAVTLQADHGIIKATGKIKANSKNAKNKGGDIIIGRDDKVDPVTGKTTTVLAKATDVRGATLESQGGFVETSGEYLETEAITVKAKDWLLDPSNIEIVADTASVTGTPLPAAPQTADIPYEATTTSRVRASTIAGNLNNGTNVTLSTGVDANSTTGDEGNIVVNAAIEKTGSQSASLTLEANNRIIVNQRIGKKAAPADGDTGDLNVTLIANGNRNTAAQGSVVMNNVIDGGKGKVNITATSKTGWEGLIFQGTSGITAGTYTVKGSSLSTAVRFNGGTATFNSSSGDSLIEGNGGGFGGVFASSGNTINLNTTGTATTTLASGASSAGGMRFGFGGGVTVNTNGNVTIGSHNDNSSLFVQANVNVNSGHLTLKGKSVGNGIGLQDGSGTPTQINVNNGSSLTMKGIATGSGNGIDLRPQGAANSITMSGANAGQRGTLNLIGDSNTGAGIYTNFATITSDGGNINLTGTSQGNGLVHDGLIRSGGDSSGGVVTLIGNSTGTASSRLGVNLSTGTVQGDAVIVEGTSRSSAQGVYTSANATIMSVTSDVSIKGKSNTGTATHLQGVVTGQSGVTITGETNGSSTNARSVLIENTITAVTGDITVTGKIDNNTDTNQRAITLAGAASKLDAKNGNIDLKTDSLFINSALGNNTAAMISAAGNGKGIVSINTTTEGRNVVLGSSDTATKLGIDQGEIAKIAAQKLIIGNSTNGGAIHIETAINASHIDTLSLQTKSDKTITQTTTGTNSGSIAAKNVEIVSGNVTLNNANNNITTLAAKAASLNFVNKEALVVGNVNGRSGIETTRGASVVTRTGDLTIDESVVNSGNDAVVLGAGISKSAGDKTGGDIKTRSGAFVTNDDGKTFIYTGSTQNTGLLSNLHSDFSELRLSGDSTDANNNALAQNADSKVAFETNNTRNTISNGGKAQVLFREAISLDTSSINSANLDSVYGDTNTAKSASADLLAAMRTKLKQANPGQFITRSANSDNDVNTFKVSKAGLIDGMTSTLNVSDTGPTSNFSISDFLKANADGTSYSYGQWSSNKFTATIKAGEATISVKKRALDGSISTGNTVYGEALQSGTVSFTNKVGSDDIVALKRISVTGKTSTSGNLEAGTHTSIQDVHSLSGNDAGNYTFTNVTGDYTVTKRPLTATAIAAVSTEYGTPAAAGAVTLNDVIKSTNGVTDLVTAKTAVNGTSLSSSNNINAGEYTQSATGIEGNDAKNYEFTSFTTAGKTYSVTPKSLAASYLAKDKVFDGSATADVTGTVAPISGDKVNVLHTSASFDSPDIGTAKTVTVSGISLSGADVANYKVDSTVNAGNTAKTKASITAVPPKPPVPVVPTDGNSRVKVPVGSANPFALASAEDLADDTCSANSIENCHCEESSAGQGIDICYEPRN